MTDGKRGGPREGAGRPAIGGKVLVPLGNLLPRVKAYAAAQRTSQNEAIRQLVELSLLEWEQERDMVSRQGYETSTGADGETLYMVGDEWVTAAEAAEYAQAEADALAAQGDAGAYEGYPEELAPKPRDKG